MTREEWSKAQDQAYLEAISAGCYPCADAPYPADIERIAELEAALHRINALIDSPARFNPEVQAVLDSVIDTSDTKFERT